MTDLGNKQEALLELIKANPGLTFLQLVPLNKRNEAKTARALQRLYIRGYIQVTDSLHYITHKGIAYLQSSNWD